MDTKRQARTIERQCTRRQSRVDKRARQDLADFAFSRFVARFEQAGQC